MATEDYAVAVLTTIEGIVAGTMLVRKPGHVVASWRGWLPAMPLLRVREDR